MHGMRQLRKGNLRGMLIQGAGRRTLNNGKKGARSIQVSPMMYADPESHSPHRLTLLTPGHGRRPGIFDDLLGHGGPWHEHSQSRILDRQGSARDSPETFRTKPRRVIHGPPVATD